MKSCGNFYFQLARALAVGDVLLLVGGGVRLLLLSLLLLLQRPRLEQIIRTSVCPPLVNSRGIDKVSYPYRSPVTHQLTQQC